MCACGAEMGEEVGDYTGLIEDAEWLFVSARDETARINGVDTVEIVAMDLCPGDFVPTCKVIGFCSGDCRFYGNRIWFALCVDAGCLVAGGRKEVESILGPGQIGYVASMSSDGDGLGPGPVALINPNSP